MPLTPKCATTSVSACVARQVTDALRRHPEAVQALRAEEFRFGFPNLNLHPYAGILKQFKYALVWGTSVKHRPQKVGKEHVLQDEDIVQARRPTSSCCFGNGPTFGHGETESTLLANRVRTY